MIKLVSETLKKKKKNPFVSNNQLTESSIILLTKINLQRYV